MRKAAPERAPRPVGPRAILAAILLALVGTAPITEGSGSRLRSSAAAAGQTDCASCHRLDPLFSHPVDVVPSMDVPSALPLIDGRLDCLTCHEPHGRDAARGARLRDDLQRTDGCTPCHQTGRRLADTLCATALGRAHLDADTAPARGVRLSSESLDAETVTCLSCHDGSVAREVVHAGPRGTLGAMNLFARMKEHPIGVRYRLNAGRSSGSPLVPRRAVDPRVRLFGDRVGCGSCHSPYSTRDDQLVMANDHSRLCLSCHDL